LEPTPRNPYAAPSSNVGDGEPPPPMPQGPVTSKRGAALYWRVVFLVAFGILSARLGWGNWGQWGYMLIAVLCLASAVLLWLLSPLARYPLYAVTFYMIGGTLVGGITNYLHDPALSHKPLEAQVISWLIPGVPAALLVSCCVFARRLTPKR
jgi:hypothetical protein